LRAIVPTPPQQALLARFVRDGGRLVTFYANDPDKQGRVWAFIEEIDAPCDALPVYARGEDWVELIIPPYDWLDALEPGLSTVIPQITTSNESYVWTFDGKHYSGFPVIPSWRVIPLGKGWVMIGPRPALSTLTSLDVILSTLWSKLLQEGIA
jgi:hypothetical protein